MKISVLTLFPEILRGFFESSIMAKAVERGLMSYELVNVRDYATDKHHKCDDEVFGGGPGMLMLPGPLGRALEAAGCKGREGASALEAAGCKGREGASALEAAGCKGREGARALEASGSGVLPDGWPGKRTVYLTPSGRLLNQELARDLAREEELVLICGRYEGVDQRVIDRYVTDEVSIGDYVLSSGEVAALVLVDAVYRLVPGVISGESLEEESFGASPGGLLLEYPQYTRPADYDNMRVPEVLTSGHHAKIVRWRLRESIKKTLAYRPELLAVEGITDEVRKLLREILTEGREHEPDAEDSGTEH
jgi:tRNA (guanine37-N1)-methyltransferase